MHARIHKIKRKRDRLEFAKHFEMYLFNFVTHTLCSTTIENAVVAMCDARRTRLLCITVFGEAPLYRVADYQSSQTKLSLIVSFDACIIGDAYIGIRTVEVSSVARILFREGSDRGHG